MSPIRIEPPIEKTFILERSDKEMGNTGDPTTVTIIQAREGGNLQRLQLWEKFERTFEAGADGDIKVAQEVNPSVVKRREVFLTLVASNIEVEDGDKVKPLFKFPLKEAEFNLAWAKLPPVMADEIHEKVLEVNLDWAVSGEGS